MKPEDVPAELVTLALAEAGPGCEQDARRYLAAVLAAHEAMVRKQVALEIEREHWRKAQQGISIGALLHAARIARGSR